MFVDVRPRAIKRRARLFASCAIVGALGAGFFLGSATAKADSGDLVTWALSNGFNGTPQAIVIRGSLVCTDLSLGDNGEQAAQDLWLHTGIADIRDARAFVIEAVDNLCPQYDRRGQAAPAPAAPNFGPERV